MARRNNPRAGRGNGSPFNISKVFGLNIGTAMFGLLFLYMIISAVIYMTSTHIESYEVISGPLSRNETYTGLVLREEHTVTADVNGYLTYYAREGDKINANGAVYGVSLAKAPETQAELSQDDLSSIRKEMLSFSKGFNTNNFNSTYSFKYLLKGNILQYAGVTQVTDEKGNNTSAISFGNQTIAKAQNDGIVLYSKDGYENVTLDNVNSTHFDQNTYHETDLKTEAAVKVGQEVYTIITDEKWTLLIPLSDKQAVKLSDRSTIRVKFLKDGMTQSGDFSIMQINGLKYGRIDFNKGLIRYASDRFLDIELVTNNATGLKIPLSSIVTKEFFLIPSDYEYNNKQNNEVGFLVEKRQSNGKYESRFVEASIYATEEMTSRNAIARAGNSKYLYYVDKSVLSEGDILVSDEQNRFIVGEIGILEGVYCINKGYAVFRRIEVLDQNEEYAIVSKSTNYGITRYDHIVKNADKVKEEEVLY